ncbi:Uncharacterised protein [Mycobacteroides abscessus subsp. bolletii]|nr:Uncharacterised protein [Mycobacteroides abscessus subsp. bolletii]SHR74490.1 Uncharacterised protein [Mycobacteroides abscessus subsp. bolletii]SHT17800.1 Uncharacterised protein [Mycobacteroides abscessus subsp. bolletii]SKG04147.1 Uncharacterised protein [Mycobacteroides abscessus subsp. bolletii]SKG71783.1 Uncharacterised protein [Mycobacteroides abscessus subsp. bolletii]
MDEGTQLEIRAVPVEGLVSRCFSDNAAARACTDCRDTPTCAATSVTTAPDNASRMLGTTLERYRF